MAGQEYDHTQPILSAGNILDAGSHTQAIVVTDPTDAVIWMGYIQAPKGTIVDFEFRPSITVSEVSGVISVASKWQINPQGLDWEDIDGTANTSTWPTSPAEISSKVFLTAADFTNKKMPGNIRMVITASPGAEKTYTVTTSPTGVQIRVQGVTE